MENYPDFNEEVQYKLCDIYEHRELIYNHF
jgi:hypothetical protein